ncbi:MAG: 3-keto-5-aminohexanoate cleavage protein [Thermonemataceae bacterium]
MKSLIINFTPTGIIPRKEHTPYIPISPEEIIEQVHQAYELGITVVHLHAREANGDASYKATIYRPILEGLRKHCPKLVLGVSLSGRNFSEFEKRSEVLALQPDMGSLTLGSLNFMKQASLNAPDMIQRLLEKMDDYGVNPELECFDMGMINYAKYLISKQMIHPPYYFNLLVGNIATAQADLLQIGLMIKELPNASYWALGGIGSFQQVANSIAIACGGGVRIGLEDNIWQDAEKTQLASNHSLLERIHQLAAIAERPIQSPESFGKAGFYNKKVHTNN